MKQTTGQHRSLTEACASVMEAAIKVPQKFVDYAREVGSTLLFAELTYRNWKPRGLTDQQIMDKITAHGEKQKKTEDVELHELMSPEEREANRKIVRRAKVDAKINASRASYLEKQKKRNKFDGGPNVKISSDFQASADGLAEVNLDEDHGRRTPDVTKSLKLVTGLDAEEMECFLYDLAEHFELEAIDYDKDTANPDFVKLSKTLETAANNWRNRKGN